MSALNVLKTHAARLAREDLSRLVAEGGARDSALRLEGGGLVLDARKQRLDLIALDVLTGLVRSDGFRTRRDDLLSGRIVNLTEARPALHAGLRDPARLADAALAESLMQARAKTRAFAEACAAGLDTLGGRPPSRIVNIGIGGSDLGPRFVWDALKAWRRPGVELRFVSNLDPADLDDALEGADLETTLICVTSKSFRTQETLLNALEARRRLAAALGEDAADARFAAATANPAAAADFGVPEARVFPFDDGVGGRYSVWSAAGLCLEIGLGAEAFAAFRDGALAMDRHFETAEPQRNIPVLKALIDVWNRAGRGLPARCVAAYSSRLERLPAYLQQLEMESLGKRVSERGEPLAAPAGGALVWGGRGSDIQHSVFQWLHQGLEEVPVDFIAVGDVAASGDARARALLANLAAQSAALLQGRTGDGPLGAHKTLPGGRASSILLLPTLDPASLGALIALHEHKVFTEGWLYGLDPFDQWGVELGKVLAGDILEGRAGGFDPATRDLIARLDLGPSGSD